MHFAQIVYMAVRVAEDVPRQLPVVPRICVYWIVVSPTHQPHSPRRVFEDPPENTEGATNTFFVSSPACPPAFPTARIVPLNNLYGAAVSSAGVTGAGSSAVPHASLSITSPAATHGSTVQFSTFLPNAVSVKFASAAIGAIKFVNRSCTTLTDDSVPILLFTTAQLSSGSALAFMPPLNRSIACVVETTALMRGFEGNRPFSTSRSARLFVVDRLIARRNEGEISGACWPMHFIVS